MTYEENLVWYATAPRVTAGIIHQFSDKDKCLHKSWVGKLRGKIVSTEKGFKFKTKGEAIANAKEFRASAASEAKEKGIFPPKGE